MSAQEIPNEVSERLGRRADLRAQAATLQHLGAIIRTLTGYCTAEMAHNNDWLRYCDVDTSKIENPSVREPMSADTTVSFRGFLESLGVDTAGMEVYLPAEDPSGSVLRVVQ